MIPPKNKPLRKPLELSHGNGIKKPATMGVAGETVAGWNWAKEKPPEKSGGIPYELNDFYAQFFSSGKSDSFKSVAVCCLPLCRHASSRAKSG